jgi:hypothetical protein
VWGTKSNVVSSVDSRDWAKKPGTTAYSQVGSDADKAGKESDEEDKGLDSSTMADWGSLHCGVMT